jgi:hypothetical protein
MRDGVMKYFFATTEKWIVRKRNSKAGEILTPLV